MPDNSTDVKVGKFIAMIVEKGDDWKNVQVPKSDEKSQPKSIETKSKEEQSTTGKETNEQGPQ